MNEAAAFSIFFDVGIAKVSSAKLDKVVLRFLAENIFLPGGSEGRGPLCIFWRGLGERRPSSYRSLCSSICLDFGSVKVREMGFSGTYSSRTARESIFPTRRLKEPSAANVIAVAYRLQDLLSSNLYGGYPRNKLLEFGFSIQAN